jgi:hypothetical protein
MTNAERQRKWVEKNRALFNLRRRNARKNLSSGSSHDDDVSGSDGSPVVSGPTQNHPPAQTSKDETLLKLRDLMKVEQEKPTVEVPAPTKVVRRSETGMIISEEEYQRRLELEERAREKGFEIDKYAQA